MSDKPSYRMAYAARKKDPTGSASVEVEGAVDKTKPSFLDKNLDPRLEPGDSGEKVRSEPARPGGSITVNPNAPSQKSRGVGSTKPDSEGLVET